MLIFKTNTLCLYLFECNTLQIEPQMIALASHMHTHVPDCRVKSTDLQVYYEDNAVIESTLY